ncbi:MAG: redoxin domain-containing protein [Proteobacteria bacterium]|nr:redoxin domain-containing protein [Pseudomonadota bacterium]
MEQTTHPHPSVGETAPDFRLPAAGGGQIALSDYLGSKAPLLWFSKGLFCPFCRRNMARLSQSYTDFVALDAEVLQITHNTQQEADTYFRNYHLATPYLCDADRQVHEAYGVGLEQQSLGAMAENMLTSSAMVAHDLLLHGEKSPLPTPALRMGSFQPSQLVVAVDRAGLVRYVWSGGPFDALPTVAELLSLFQSMGAEVPAAAQAH